MPNNEKVITPKQFDEWLKSMPLSERKKKQDRIARSLNVSKRTIENWRGGRVITGKHQKAIQEIMRGGDVVTVEFSPEVHDLLKAKAEAKGFKTISEFLEALSKMLLSAILLGLIIYAACSKTDEGIILGADSGNTGTNFVVPISSK